MNRLMRQLWKQSHKEINRIYKLFDEYGYRLTHDGKIYLNEGGEIEIIFRGPIVQESNSFNEIIVPNSWELKMIHEQIMETIDLSIHFDMDILKMEIIKQLHGIEVIATDEFQRAITSHTCPDCRKFVVDFMGHTPQCKLCQINEIMTS